MRDFKHTMDVLVKAYLNDTLKHSTCQYCAVGNIIHAAGWPIPTIDNFSEFGGLNNTSWKCIFFTGTGKSHQLKYPPIPGLLEIEKENALKTIESTGYSVDELARVEFAFETASCGNSEEDWMFNGLIAVLEVLADIHGVDFSGKKVYEDQLTEIFATK